eukprot:5169033-Amphidinium_carterae.4
MDESLPDFDGDMKVEPRDLLEETPLLEHKDETEAVAAAEEGCLRDLLPASEETAQVSFATEAVVTGVKAAADEGEQQASRPEAERDAGQSSEAAVEPAPDAAAADDAPAAEQHTTTTDPAGAGVQTSPAHVEEQSKVDQEHRAAALRIARDGLVHLVWTQDELNAFIEEVADTLGQVRESVHRAWNAMKEHYPSYNCTL